MSGSPINDEPSYPQSLSFLLPRQFNRGLLYLHVDKSFLDSIHSDHWLAEEDKSNEDDENYDQDRVESGESHYLDNICSKLDKSIASGSSDEKGSIDNIDSGVDEGIECEEDRNPDSNGEEERLVLNTILSELDKSIEGGEGRNLDGTWTSR